LKPYILGWNLIVRMKWVLRTAGVDWFFNIQSGSHDFVQSDDWKFKGMYWFVVGRVLWLVMRVVIGALMKASLQTGVKCTNLHSPSSLPIKMQTRESLHLFEFPIFRHLSLKMTSSQDVEILVTISSPFQDSWYFHPHDQIPCKYFCNLFCFQCLSKWPLLSGFLASLGYCCYFLFSPSFFL